MNAKTLFGHKIHFGITQKMLLVLTGALALTALLGAILASYFTNQQNEKAAFSNLNNQLLAWQKDLQTSTEHLKNIAIATTNDRVVLHQLTEILTFESSLTHDAIEGGQAEFSRTLAYHKTVSINRLALALRTGGFTSISVYTQGQLSHHISNTEVGMMLEKANNDKTWIAAPIGEDGDLSLEHWPAWHQQAIPTIATSSPIIKDRPSINFSFPTPTQTNIEFIIPVQGFLEDMLVDARIHPEIQVFSDFSIAGDTSYTQYSTSNKPPTILAVIVFRKVLDNPYLESLAEKTGTVPIIFSPDGQHKQSSDTIQTIPSELLQKARATLTASVPSVSQNVVYNNHNSFYAAILPWQLEQQPRLILGMVASRAGTLQNIKQTVAAILLTSSIILLLSLALGIWLAKRLMDPITNLTSAVKEITSSIRLENGEQKQRKHHALETLTLINSSAPDEVGDLAKAFNIMLAEQQQLFENLELRVKERTSALHMQTRYLRTLIDMLPMWTWFKDTRSSYLAVNQSFAESYGLSPAKLIGKSDSEVLPSKLAEQQIADDVEVMRSRQQKTVELEKNIPSGTIWLETFKAPVIDEDGAILGTVGATRDITEYKTAVAARETALIEAQKLAKLRSEFIAQMSHELRTPLNGILGYAQILLRDSGQNEQLTTGLNIIQKSGEHLLTLINDILDLARIEAGKTELVLHEVNLANFLDVISEMSRVRASQKQLEYIYECAPNLPKTVLMDEKRLRQILLNLLTNAIKFTDHGRVSFRVSVTTEDKIKFEVEDTGIGISKQYLDVIFHPFEQVGTEQHRAQGTGLGLSISRQYVRQMGGEIYVTSEDNQGSTFWFELNIPSVKNELPPAPSQVLIKGYEGKRRKILVIDDLAENRSVLVDFLTLIGFEMIEAINGVEGIEKTQKEHPDLILMDIVMPEMNGLELTQRLRSMPEYSGLPIIAVSASTSNKDIKSCLEIGMNTFLAKPVNFHDLLSHIAQLLNLNWIYDDSSKPASTTQNTSDILTPPLSDMKVLHDLALQGNMNEIIQRVMQITKRDQRYHDFAEHLNFLAKSYQSKAILVFVEHHLNKAQSI